jgi:hypothetical protein
VATQPGETDNYGVVDHVRVIYEHLRDRLGISIGRRDALQAASIPFTHVLVNDNMSPAIPDEWGVTRPTADEAALAEFGVEVIHADVVDVNRPTRHDPLKLAGAVVEALAPPRTVSRPAPLAVVKAVATSLLG